MEPPSLAALNPAGANRGYPALLRVGHLDHGHGADCDREPHLETCHLLDQNVRLRRVGGDRHGGPEHW
jgi:hypothetical protein